MQPAWCGSGSQGALRADSICSALANGVARRAACEASDTPEHLLSHIATKANIALNVIDSKVSELSEGEERTAGREVVRLLEESLFARACTGNVVISAAKLTSRSCLQEAAQVILGKSFAGKVFFAFDQERNKAPEALTALRDLPSKARAFGTGISACLPGWYRTGIRTADRNRRGGRASFVYVWTLDRRRSMEKYLEAGAQGIITNYPSRLRQAIEAQGGKLATRATVLPWPVRTLFWDGTTECLGRTVLQSALAQPHAHRFYERWNREKCPHQRRSPKA